MSGAPCPLCHDPDTVSDGGDSCTDSRGNESLSVGHSAIVRDDHGGSDSNCSSDCNVGNLNDSNGGGDSGNGSDGGSGGNGKLFFQSASFVAL